MAASPGPPGAKRARRAGGGGGGGALGGGEAPGGGSGGGGARGEGRARWPGAFGRMQAWLEAEAAAGAGLLAGHLDVRGPGAGGAPGGHTVFAADARAAGEPLVRVPQSCVLHWGRVVEGGFGRRLEAVRQNVVRAQPEAGRAALQVHEQTVLLLFMAAGRRDPACPWHAYFETMPGEPQHLLAWPADLLDAEFAGTHLAHATEKERAELRAQYEALREGIEKGGGALPGALPPGGGFPSWEDLLWAHGNYLSRRFHPGMATGAPEGCEVPCLIPGLDMFNHRTGEKVTLEADAEHAQIVCDAPVAAGTEIFINYGHKSNEELLFAYGFCLRDNPLDLVTIQLACDGAGEVGAYRRQLLRACGVPWKEAGVAPPEETDGNPAKGGGRRRARRGGVAQCGAILHSVPRDGRGPWRASERPGSLHGGGARRGAATDAGRGGGAEEKTREQVGCPEAAQRGRLKTCRALRRRRRTRGGQRGSGRCGGGPAAAGGGHLQGRPEACAPGGHPGTRGSPR